MFFEKGVIVRLVDGVEASRFEITQPRCKAFTDQGKEPEDVIASATGIDEMLINFQNGFMVEQSIEYVRRFTLARADRQDTVIAILV